MAISQSVTDIGKSCPSHKFLTPQICLLTIHENKILAKISQVTVVVYANYHLLYS